MSVHAGTIIPVGGARPFDPDIVDAFAAISEQFRDIAARFAD